MSFFDEGDEPRRQPRPRRTTAARTAPTDQQTLLVRRAVALGAGVLLLIIFVFGLRSCLDSRKERALKDYNREVGTLVQESDRLVSRPFFDLLTSGDSTSPLALQDQVNQLRVVAEEQAKRARGLDVPDEMKPAQSSLLLALDFRAGGLKKIADRLQTALGKAGAEDAVAQITGQMAAFLASDVIYSQRVGPLVLEALNDAGIEGQRVQPSQFLPDVDWLDESFVADALGASVSNGGTRDGKPAPGLHGHGLVSVTAGGLTLQPGGAVNRIPAAANTAFDVKFANQGENDESGVKVKITIEGAGKPIEVEKTIDQTRAGTEETVSIPLGQAPPIGTPVTIKVSVEKVPGEKKTDNNSQEYTAVFTR